MRVKVTNNITYFEARKVVGQKHETSFFKKKNSAVNNDKTNNKT